MTWIKLEDKAPRHPKVAGLSDKAFRVWVTAMCYASEFLTDGILPPAYLITVKQAIQDELVAAGLWDRVTSSEQSGGAVVLSIHDYLGHQTSKASVERKKETNRSRQSRFRNAVTNALVTEPENREQIQRTDAEVQSREQGRSRVQGSGAFEPGSLPRDHMRHALCGPSMRICLLSWQYDALVKAYNAPENPHGTRAVIAQFIEQLESGLKPESSIGPFSWIEKEFHAYLKSVGRVAPSIQAKSKPFSVEEAMARKAAAQGRPS